MMRCRAPWPWPSLCRWSRNRSSPRCWPRCRWKASPSRLTRWPSSSPEPIEPIEVAAVLPPPEEMPEPIEPIADLPVASAVAIVGDLSAEVMPASSDVAVSSELELPLASAVAVFETVPDDIPVASAVAFVAESSAVEEPVSAIVAAVSEPEATPIEAVVMATELVTPEAPVVEPEAVELPVASAVAVVGATADADVPLINPIEAVAEIPLASAVEVVSNGCRRRNRRGRCSAAGRRSGGAYARPERAGQCCPVQSRAGPAGPRPDPDARPRRSAGTAAVVSGAARLDAGTSPLMHSGVLTPDRLGPPPLAEPVAEVAGRVRHRPFRQRPTSRR